MPPTKVADNDMSKRESHANELLWVLAAVNALTSKVQSLQLDLDSQKRISQVPDDNLIQRKFWKDPLTLHFSVNPKKIYLSFDGKNFPMWKDTILKTISYLLSDYNTTSSLFAVLQRRCARSARLDKLDTTNKLLNILRTTEHRDTSSWLHSLQETYARLMSWKMSFSECFGLLVQANIEVPETLNRNTFDILLHQRLNHLDTTPSFETVSEAIQAAETDATVVINPEIIDLDASASAMHYFPPGNSVSQPVTHRQPIYQAPGPLSNLIGHLPPAIPQHAIKKATSFCRRGQSQSLIDKFGDTFLYCKQGRHWHSDCEQFWADIAEGKLKAPHGMQQPQDMSKKGKARQVYHVHVDGIDDGSLLDSAADVHVSGINPDFTLKQKLTNPLILNLASTHKSSYLTGIGSLMIPTANGALTVDNVYFCEDICFKILSLGRLVEAGYHPVFTSTSLKLVSPANVEFYTVFHKNCWYIPRLSPNIAAISKIPLQSAFSWHERLGHAST
ncbi:hypothetical protein O181_042016 [Austropuccinia psidii MF-1]|uniref:GAG-pre-integrase domain-containing protein n=1 Tax=Austropuccinia psidii MF-1 TaxID=1389203 RepID=A0A9Q3HER3_9BASI|nr:hypothetical protein [Austropuccinia psidii MF-1]